MNYFHFITHEFIWKNNNVLLNFFIYMILQDLPPEVKEAQEKKLEELKKQQEIHNRLAIERKLFLRDRKIKFFGK